ncbi:MAG TPA: hypothetical protein VH351_15965 [Bryobacteraceae bacterium]|jgi:hypothetical protein|nr:hypothetical protein [Bryobacteraceae bacterium]
MLLDPLPGVAQPERIVAIENQAANGEPVTTSYLDFRDFRDNRGEPRRPARVCRGGCAPSLARCALTLWWRSGCRKPCLAEHLRNA